MLLGITSPRLSPQACRWSRRCSGLTRHVLGMDLHPVAVTLARVTYLLAIGRERLTHPDRGPIQVPVYLGDAVQWRREADDLFSGGNLVIETDDQKQLFDAELRFPEKMLEDPGKFNQIIEAMTKLAGSRKPGTRRPEAVGILPAICGIPIRTKDAGRDVPHSLGPHDDGRDHIWSYYVRNLARPWWLALPQNRVDCAGRKSALAGLSVHDRGDAGDLSRIQQGTRALARCESGHASGSVRAVPGPCGRART